MPGTPEMPKPGSAIYALQFTMTAQLSQAHLIQVRLRRITCSEVSCLLCPRLALICESAGPMTTSKLGLRHVSMTEVLLAVAMVLGCRALGYKASSIQPAPCVGHRLVQYPWPRLAPFWRELGLLAFFV